MSTSKTVEPGSADWLAEHGIDSGVWASRGVWDYQQSDAAKVRNAVTQFIRPKQGVSAERSVAGRLRWVDGIIQQSPGLVMPKHPPALDYGLIAPQLRPNDAVLTNPIPRWRFHDELNEGDDWPTFPTTGNPLPRKWVLDPTDEYVRDHIIKRHDGFNPEGVHKEETKLAKYLFLPGADEKRIDLHPIAAERLRSAHRVFFVLEGALKNDAVLSQDEAVFSVPSVTLWKRAELRRFAKEYLRGRHVIVVPDSDWKENPLVDRQALLVRTVLRKAGVADTYIAAPTAEDGAKAGVDDFLGAGHNLDDMVLRGKEAGPGVYAWNSLSVPDHWRLVALSLHADSEGKHHRNIESFARILGLRHGHPEDVVDALKKLEEARAIEVHGSLDYKVFTYPIRDKRGKKVDEVSVRDWEHGRPTIELAADCRPIEPPETLLGDFWAKEAYRVAKEAEQRAIRAERMVSVYTKNRAYGR